MTIFVVIIVSADGHVPFGFRVAPKGQYEYKILCFDFMLSSDR